MQDFINFYYVVVANVLCDLQFIFEVFKTLLAREDVLLTYCLDGTYHIIPNVFRLPDLALRALSQYLDKVISFVNVLHFHQSFILFITKLLFVLALGQFYLLFLWCLVPCEILFYRRADFIVLFLLIFEVIAVHVE